MTGNKGDITYLVFTVAATELLLLEHGALRVCECVCV